MTILLTIAAQTASYGFRLWMVLPLMTALERVSPVEPHPLAARLKAAAFWSLAVPVTGLIMALFSDLWPLLGIHSLITAKLWFGWNVWTKALSVVTAPIAAAILGDFFFYWAHRAEHAFLWRFHRVHHSITEMNAVNSYHHISEELVRTVLIVAPSSILISFDIGPVAPIVALLLLYSGFYIHSTVPFHFGWARIVLCDNRFHRIHHSTQPRHFGRNFCAFSPLWDVVFGTAYFPARGEWPQTGLADFAEPRGIVEWLLAPFRPMQPSVSAINEPISSTEAEARA
jgi:sterol desaturase/sphingolipid hydroxylase (fatty acid hydroxylase superfamily)